MKKLFDPQSALGYRVMVWMFKAMDLFVKPDGRLDAFRLQKGQVVVDYGCGPGRYIKRAAEQVGPMGRVWAADIHPMAIDLVRDKIAAHRLTNVVPVLLGRADASIDDACADVVYALDMFHQVDNPAAFLSDIHRIAKPGAALYLEDGHQPRRRSLQKVRQSDLWQVKREHPRYIELVTVIDRYQE